MPEALCAITIYSNESNMLPTVGCLCLSVTHRKLLCLSVTHRRVLLFWGSSSKPLHPFLSSGFFFNTGLLVQISGLFCVRGVLKFFAKRNLSNMSAACTSKHVVKHVKETRKTVTASQLTRFDEPYTTSCFGMVKEISKEGHVFDLGLCKFVEHFHVVSSVYMRCCEGPAVPKDTSKRWTGRQSLAGTFFQNTMTHVLNLFTPFTVVKQKQVERNTGCIGFPYLFIGSHICDGRNCELLNSMMTQICSRNRSRPSIKRVDGSMVPYLPEWGGTSSGTTVGVPL